MNKLGKRILGLLTATGIFYSAIANPLPAARAMDFPKQGKFAVGGEAKFTTNRKVKGSDYTIKLKSSEYTGNVSYGLTDWLAPYVKIGTTDLKAKVEDESLSFGNELLWGVGGMGRIKGLPGGLEARLKAGYESVSGLKSSYGGYSVPAEIRADLHKVPVEGTLYKDFGKVAIEGGVSYEHLRGNAKAYAMGFEEKIDLKGKNNLGGLARLEVKPTENFSISAFYNSIGNTFGAEGKIRF